MPPRSVCLNVFTTSLGNDVGAGKEREVEVNELEDKMEGIETVVERERHDSVQGPPDDPVVTAPPYSESMTTPSYNSPVSTTSIDASTFPLNIGARSESPQLVPITMPSTCSTCNGTPASGSSLARCSRCKSAFYCSKSCQKSAWKLHKYDCVPTGALRGLFASSSAIHTPDISTPASPVAEDLTPEPLHGVDPAAANMEV